MFYENKINSHLFSTDTTPLNFPLHVHQYIELTYVRKGELEMQIGTEKYSLLPGCLAIVFPNVPHDYRTISENNLLFHIMNCYPDLLPMHQKTLFEKYPQAPVLRPEQIHADIPYAIRRLYELDTTTDTSGSLISALISLILCRAYPELQLTDFKNTPPRSNV